MDGRKLFIVISIILTLASLVIFVPWDAIITALTPLPDTIEDQLNDAIDQGFDGIIVYVDQGGETKDYSAGWFNKEEHITLKSEDLFKIASISKLYIAVATTKLIDEGKLSIDATLKTLLPDIAEHIENSEQITLTMLLQHRSGIPNFVDLPEFSWFDLKTTNLQAVEMVYGLTADFRPDKKYSYSNTNYVLLGEILDRTLGYSHHQYISEEILAPLGLSSTYHVMKDVDLDQLVSGYDIESGYDFKDLDYIHPGGSMVSTAEDVGKFIRALNTGSLLSEREHELYSSLYVYDHTGLLPGYQSIARYHESLDAVVIQFVNTSGGDAWASSEVVYKRIIKILEEDNDVDE